MKLQTLRRTGTAAFAVLALSASLAACGDDNSNTKSSSDTPAAADTDNAGADTFGDGCASIPTSGAGSFNGMVQDTVGTAASNNPLLKTLVAAVGAAGLVDTLNDPNATYTVFAPYDDAFKAVPADTLTSLLDGAKGSPDSDLGKILLHHVLGEQDDPATVVGEKTTANGDTLTIKGDPESGMTVSDGQVTAKVLCGNVPTANATVYVIDSVMTGATLK